MTFEELAEQCIDSLNHPERSPGGKCLITLVGKKTLFPKGRGPRPIRLLCQHYNGNKVWHYDAMNVLAALCAAELISLEDEPSKDGKFHLERKP